MSDLIDRQAAIDAAAFGITYAKKINKETGEVEVLFEQSNKELQKAIDRIKELPSAERKGKWEYKMVNEGVIGFRCSACGDEVLLPTPFCRNCGADMRGGSDAE